MSGEGKCGYRREGFDHDRDGHAALLPPIAVAFPGLAGSFFDFFALSGLAVAVGFLPFVDEAFSMSGLRRVFRAPNQNMEKIVPRVRPRMAAMVRAMPSDGERARVTPMAGLSRAVVASG